MKSRGSTSITLHPSSFTLHPSTGAVLHIVLLAAIFAFTFFGNTDEDLWWHLATGRYIVETGSIPEADVFSFTMAGRPWVPHEWLAELLIYVPYRLGGYVAAVALFAASIALAFGLLLRTLRLVGAGTMGSALITFWCAAMSLGSWKVRPQAFSFLLFALVLYLLLRSRQHRDRWLWSIPPVMALWANLHAGYITGLILIGLFSIGEVVNRLGAGGGYQSSAISHRSSVVGHRPWAARRQQMAPSTQHPAPNPSLAQSSALGPQASIARYLGVFVGAVAATVLNPRGPAMLLYPFTYAGNQNASMRLIAEWQSPDFHRYHYLIFAAALLLPMVSGGRRRVDWAVAAPALALAAMSLQSARVIPFFAIAVAPHLGLWLCGRPAAPAGAPVRVGAVDRRSRLNWLPLAAALAVILGSVFSSEAAQTGREPRATGMPVGGAAHVGAHHPDANLLNAYHWGGYLIWAFYPERRVFIDGRADMYGDAFVEEFAAAYHGGPEWESLLDRYGVEVALLDRGSALAAIMRASGKWSEEFTGPVESVLVKKRQ